MILEIREYKADDPPDPPPNPTKFRGLGDLIFHLLKWFPAKWKPKNCRCEARRAWLNRWFPLK